MKTKWTIIILALGFAMADTKAEFSVEKMASVDPWTWAIQANICLGGSRYFGLEGHEYQVEPMQSDAQVQVCKKATQGGWTEAYVLKSIHGLKNDKYPSGILYLMPDREVVADFSSARFDPLIADNYEQIGRFVTSTDRVGLKKIGDAYLYLRGATLSQKISAVEKESAKLSSIPVDMVVYDELDYMHQTVPDKAGARMAHSEIQQEVYLGNPMLPGCGIDKKYQESDQRHRMLKCGKCNKYTCLELEFPECVRMAKNGLYYRACIRCGAEVYPRDGEWVPKYLKRDIAGWWWSQLNSMYIGPGRILNAFRYPPNNNLADVMRKMLGLAYVEAENRLTRGQIYDNCCLDVMASRSQGPCAMGVDVGKKLHVVIGGKRSDTRSKVLYTGRVSEFSDLHDLAERFNVRCAVIDWEPETRAMRQFRKAEPYLVLGCDEVDRQKAEIKQDDEEGLITVRRTELCDLVHDKVADGLIEYPRRNAELEEYALEMSCIAKVLDINERTGHRVYRYQQLDGDDHYYHGTGFFLLAVDNLPKLPEAREAIAKAARKKKYDVKTFGRKEKT